MPIYTYFCGKCKIEFESFASIAKKASGWKPDCPNCGSSKTRQTFYPAALSPNTKQASPKRGCCGSNQGGRWWV